MDINEEMPEPTNPYAAPQGALADKKPICTLTGVSRSRRFANFIFDIFFQWILAFFIIAIAAVTLGVDKATDMALQTAAGPLDAVLYSAYFLYFFVSELVLGRTLGKYITKTRVVSSDGSSPGAKSILIRTLVRAIPIDPLTVFFSNDRNIRGWHDSWSGTVVVSDADYHRFKENTTSR